MFRTSRRALAGAGAGLAGMLFVGATTMISAAVTLASDTWTDPVGDNGGIGPDIASVTVGNEDNDLVIAVDFTTAPPLAWSAEDEYTDSIMILGSTGPEAPPVDVLTGNGRGFSGFAIGVHAANIEEPPSFTPIVDGQSGEIRFGITSVAVDGKTVTLRVPLSAIGNPEDVHLFVTAGREGGAEIGLDTYPDGGWASSSMAAARGGAGDPRTVVAVAIAAIIVLTGLGTIGWQAAKRVPQSRSVPAAVEPSGPRVEGRGSVGT